MKSRTLSFSEAQGLIPLPQPFKLGELPDKIRCKLHAIFYRSLASSISDPYMGDPYVDQPWSALTQDIHIDLLGLPINVYNSSPSRWFSLLNAFIIRGEFHSAFDFMLLILRHPDCPDGLAEAAQKIFDESGLAYRLNLAPLEIVPVASPEEGEVIIQALQDTAASKFSGAHAHLLSAGRYINENRFHDSIRESISAVESIVRILDDKNKDLNSALNNLGQKIHLHPAFKKGVSAIYGYTSDEQGIRHCMFDEKIKPDLTDALFMFGVCASFVSFLIGKAQSLDLLGHSK